MRHLGDYIRAVDPKIARLEREIAEERANMSPEEVSRSRAEVEESLAGLDGLPLDEKIRELRAQIAEEAVEIVEAEGRGA